MAAPLRLGCFEKIEPCRTETEDENIPVPRSGHRLVVDEGNLYSIGGYNPLFWTVENTEDTCYPLFRELWRFNFATRRWVKEKCEGSMPCDLASHSAILVGRKILVFGGTGVPFGESSSNDLHEYCLDTKHWRSIECIGELPQKKYGHAMVLHGNSLYIVGGTTGYVYNASVHILDLDTCVWRCPDLEEVPKGRYRHEVVCDGKYFYMLGGGTAVTVSGFSEIPVFDLKEEKWKIIRAQPDPQNGFPAPRRCHGCVQFKDVAYVIGGLNEGSILGDLWGFCLKRHKWFKHPASMPCPAYFHSVGVSKEGCLTVFGGVVHMYIDNLRSNEIFQIWLDVPSLKEMCWQKICRSMSLLQRFSRKELYGLGIPTEFLDRIS